MTLSNNLSELLKNVSSATARTLAKNKNLSVEFIDEKNKKDNAELVISINDSKDHKIIRGEIDFNSFVQRYLIKKFYQENIPNKSESKKIYKLIHDARSIVMGMIYFPGGFKNIKYLLNSKKNGINFLNIYEENIELFFYLVELFFKKKVFNYRKILRFNHRESKLIRMLNNNLNDHVNFSKDAKTLSLLLEKAKTSENESVDKTRDKKTKNNQDEIQEKNDTSQLEEKIKKLTFPDSAEKDDSYTPEKKKKNGKPKDLLENIELNNYQVFSKKNDQIAHVKDLAEINELNLLKKKLDEESPKFDFLIKKLSTKLERKLMAKQIRSWEFDLEEGLLDSSRLSRLIINPCENLTFKNEKESIAKNTIVCLLIDNSGSMRGRPIIIAANAVEILTQTLERCGVKVEILGFTTKEWKGGKSKIDWIEKGKKDKPGRLNDLLHIIYKDSSKSWKNCGKNLGLVLKDGLLKENIDGEALVWAYNRLISKEQKRKILIVVSDGAPVDDSTLSANNSNILEKHLSETVKVIEESNIIKLMAIGIGHDVSKYYKNAFTIDDADKLTEIMLEKLTELFSNQ